MPLQQVHLRINDAATGRPTPVRLRITDEARNYYPPHGHPAEFATGAGEDVGGNLMHGHDRWAYIDGSCEIAVPPGELRIEATKGPEYKTLRQTVELPAGKLALRFSIDRWTNSRGTGWFSGDIRAQSLSPHAALLEAAAEDLAVVNLLVRETPLGSGDGHTYSAFPNLAAFSGQHPCLQNDGHMVVVNTLNVHRVLGRLALLNTHRVVYPLSFGEPDNTDDWSLADWCGQCHRKNGLVVWADAFNPKVAHAGEALANLILGEVDALELDLREPGRLHAWYHLLNAGYHVSLVAGSGKDSNRTALGSTRTYALLDAGESLSYAAWIEGIRRGRTFITSGPVLTLDIDGGSIGTVHRRAPGKFELLVHFAAQSPEAVEKTEVLANGRVIASKPGAEVHCELALPDGGWLAARCWQAGRIVAHTSPQYIEVVGVSPPIDPDAVAFLDGHLRKAKDWVATMGKFEKPTSCDRILRVIDGAREKNASSKIR